MGSQLWAIASGQWAGLWLGLTVTVGCGLGIVDCAVLSAAHEASSALYRPLGHGAVCRITMVAMESQKEKIAVIGQRVFVWGRG